MKRAPLAKLGPMPTQEAGRERKASQCTPASGRGAVAKRATCTQRDGAHDYLPHSRAARRASTDRGEVGGAQPAQPASTDGCHRRSATNSEGAGAERKGFEPLVPLRVRLISNQVPSATRELPPHCTSL